VFKLPVEESSMPLCSVDSSILREDVAFGLESVASGDLLTTPSSRAIWADSDGWLSVVEDTAVSNSDGDEAGVFRRAELSVLLTAVASD